MIQFYAMSFSQSVASPFWFPDAVLLCALLLTRPRVWGVFVLGALPIRLFSEVARDIPLWFLLTTYAVDSVRGVLTALVLRRLMKNPIRFETVREFKLWAENNTDGGASFHLVLPISEPAPD
jgi:integral membrane sensor domain MASE1